MKLKKKIKTRIYNYNKKIIISKKNLSQKQNKKLKKIKFKIKNNNLF